MASFRKIKDELMACSLHLDVGTRLSGELPHSGKHMELHTSVL